MSSFSLHRFIRVMRNDLLRVTRLVLYGGAALLGMTVAIYMIRFRSARPIDDPVHVVLFGSFLIVAGLLFTGVAFRDIHHPLERNHYLMLPVSNVERLLSRYLITGPLFVLLVVLAFMASDHLGNYLTNMWINERQLRFSPFATESMTVICGYLMAHVVVLTGAICFRSHALLKTILFLLLVFFGLLLVEYVTVRIFFPQHYSWSQFEEIRPLPVELLPWFTAWWMNVVFVIGALAWILHVAYLCLRDHEATDGV